MPDSFAPINTCNTLEVQCNTTMYIYTLYCICTFFPLSSVCSSLHHFVFSLVVHPNPGKDFRFCVKKKVLKENCKETTMYARSFPVVVVLNFCLWFSNCISVSNSK